MFGRQFSIVVLLSLSLLACDDKGDGDGDGTANTGGEDSGTDTDGDGFASDVDCDDGNADVNPDAVEICDGIDNDCDSMIDDSDDDVDTATGTTFFADEDGDGFGDPDQTVAACVQPTGTTENADDCDDGNANVNPAAVEICDVDDVDENCNGTADDADATVDSSTQATMYMDGDADGFGDEADAGTLYCDPPSNTVTDNTDCDDAAININPAATEVCDGLDNDCNGSTTEAGTASFIDARGTLTDVTRAMAGTARSPAAVSLSDAGDLVICEGTWYTRIALSADIDVYSPTGDPSTTILDGAGSGGILYLGTDSVRASVRDLTLQNGAGVTSAYTGQTVGGALACEASDASASIELMLENVVMEGNTAEYGGAVWQRYCTITASDTTLADNVADYGGGIYSYFGTTDVDGGEWSSNVAAEGGAGLWYLGTLSAANLRVRGNEASRTGGALVTEYSDATLDEVVLDGNVATIAGGMVCSYGDLQWTGTTSSTSGLTGNSDTTGFGAMYLSAGCTATFDVVDFGASGSANDNEGFDLQVADGQVYVADDDARFTCTSSGCGSATTSTISGRTDSSYGGLLLGNVILPSNDGTIELFAPYTAVPASTCDLDYYVLTAASVSATSWRVEWASTGASGDSISGFQDSPIVGMVVDTSKVYALAWSSSDCGIEYDYDYGVTGETVSGMGTTFGFMYSADPGPYAEGDRIESELYTDATFYMEIDVTDL